MGVLDDLAQARRDFERGDWVAALATWSGLPPEQMSATDLRAAAEAAYLLGNRDEAVPRFQQAYDASLAAGDTAGAVHAAFHLAMTFGTGGEPALASGWTSRAQRLLTDLPGDSVEHGWVAFLQMFQALRAGDLTRAGRYADEAAGAAAAHTDRDLLALAVCAQGRLAIYGGDVVRGMALLDESMAGLAAGGLSAVVFGNVYCTAIEGCQEVSDFGRVAEWTSALHRWCSAQPGLVAFTGQCSVHRAQVMRLRGAWDEALEELDRAVERYRQSGTRDAIGLVEYERGEILRVRGRYDAAEQAYQRAAEYGYDPQPGLALLWLGRGATSSAAAAVRRLLAEPVPPVRGCRLLPGAVEVLLGVDAVDEARRAATLLEQTATSVGTEWLHATAAYTSGSVELAAGDPSGALPYLRKATQQFAHLESRYDLARARAQAGRALVALGDEESARGELTSAAEAFELLGAAPDRASVASLLASDRRPGGLTERELEVLRLVARGRSNAQIAGELVLSEKTVARHLSNIFTKIGVGSRTAAAAFAFEHDLV